jgi:shikimate dehydrogenase
MTQRLLLGLIGAGIQLSRSPALHEREGQHQGFTTLYSLIDSEKLNVGQEALPDLLAACEKTGFTGTNITHPFKQTVLAHLHELSPQAKKLGAVNTVVFKGGKRFGYNTDCSGFGEAFKRGMGKVKLNHVVQFGTGGAGAAVAQALLDLGVQKLTIVDLDKAKAQQLAKDLGDTRLHVSENAEIEVKSADGVVNCTPMGMAKYQGTPFPTIWLKAHQWVQEIVYFPLETQLMLEAKAIGCKVNGGGGMATFQAVHAFAHFTGVKPDAERMVAHFLSM